MPKVNFTPALSQPSRYFVWLKSVSPRRRIFWKPARRQSVIARSKYAAAPSAEVRLPLRLTTYNGSPVLANEISKGW